MNTWMHTYTLHTSTTYTHIGTHAGAQEQYTQTWLKINTNMCTQMKETRIIKLQDLYEDTHTLMTVHTQHDDLYIQCA